MPDFTLMGTRCGIKLNKSYCVVICY